MTEENIKKGECETSSRIKIDRMSCMHCANSVVTALESVPGVKEVSVDLNTGFADIRHIRDEDSVKRFREAVEQAGFGVVND